MDTKRLINMALLLALLLLSIPALSQKPAQAAEDGADALTPEYYQLACGDEAYQDPVAGFTNKTRTFGMGKHKGLDIMGEVPLAAKGEPIKPIAPGTVVRVDMRTRSRGGISVTVDHGNGIVSTYRHMQKKPLVARGQRVDYDTVLGYVGSTGRRSTGPHLHLEVALYGELVDPEMLLPSAYVRQPGWVPSPKTLGIYVAKRSSKSKAARKIASAARKPASARAALASHLPPAAKKTAAKSHSPRPLAVSGRAEQKPAL